MDLELVKNALSFVLFNYSGSPITVAQLMLVPCLLVLTWYLVSRLGRLIRKALQARNVSPDAVHLFSRIYLVLTITILVITSLEVLNIPLTAFAFVSGAIAIGVGFGAQNIINNFISGWILMWERPIRIGDFLEVGEARGVVESINTRSTLIRRNDGVHMLVPNSQLLENTVTNWTLIDNNARSTVRVGVAYGEDVVLVAKLIQQVLNERKEILKQPVASVIFEDFGDNALIFDAVFWICAHSETDLRMIRSNIRFRIYELFNEHNIVIAFPQRDVHLDGQLTLKQEKD
ncbi:MULTISPECIES: mechanosensitive ion channel domain-containing protein [unclassified Motilimonas]|uniref:mechanosensitive ion channel family protein n=1 Tax=Motilimonas TaxID=1914248 RepID=UPI001E3684FD|nr:MULTISPECIES: mechanosensitive ion channel domain-containing protein [unclassified Motilimonas]MCE0558975.1 mechanosensitive ion channel [Motilimonas sp. E26]MDO6527384.1 mechanosensitive ion channel [Motilimonas sp. 1_MG-2023]